MKRLRTRFRGVTLAGICLLVAACATPPESPSSPPPTPPPSQPPAQTETREQQEQTSQAPGATAQPDPSSAPSEQAADREAAAAEQAPPASAPPPPAASSPDVEITDIPLDEDGNPIVRPADEQRAAARSNPPASAGGGGAPTPAGARDAASGANTGGGTPAGADTAGSSINVGSAATAAERSANLEHDLKSKLAEFDELMRKAREEAEREQAGGGAMAGATGGSGARREPSTETGAGGQAARSSGLGNTPDTSGTNQTGTYRPATGAVPADVPDARDDDIVARQLREAATRETDPTLREKLWQEYRKYKTGIGR